MRNSSQYWECPQLINPLPSLYLITRHKTKKKDQTKYNKHTKPKQEIYQNWNKGAYMRNSSQYWECPQLINPLPSLSLITRHKKEEKKGQTKNNKHTKPKQGIYQNENKGTYMKNC